MGSIQHPEIRMSMPTTRNEALPVGHVSSTGFGSGKATQRIAFFLLDEPALMVVIADDGEVFAIDPKGDRAAMAEAKHPEWIVGVYARDRGDLTIMDDIRARCGELRRRVA
jgi:hypothetical protein